MPSKIILKKSNVTTKAPVPGDLEFGELALNYTDGKLYYKKADGNTIDSFSASPTSAVTSVGGYTGAVTAGNLLDAIKTVDGTGSGLDADTLDGNSAAAFYLASNPNGYTSNAGTVTSVGATAPVVSSGGTTPTISMSAASSGVNGYMTGAYATKLDGIATGATNVTNTNQLTNGAGFITSSSDITGNAATATTAATANALNTGNNYTANSFTASSTDAYFYANRSNVANQAGIQFRTAGTTNWYNFLDNNTNTLTWYQTATNTQVMSLTQAGVLNVVGGITQGGNQVLHAGNYGSYALPLTGGTLSGALTVNSDLIVGNNGLTNAYSGAANGKIYFGSAGADASTMYHIGTAMEDSYSRLDFRWYTGQRFYSHYNYGGFRFKEITTGNTLFSVGESDLNVRVNNGLIVSGRTTITNEQKFGPERRYYVGNLTTGASATRYEIARVYIDYNDWHSAGTIQVELQNSYFMGGDRQVWSINYDYNIVSCDLVESIGPRGRFATVTCGSPTQVSGDSYYIPVYVDTRYYGYYYAYVTTSWPEVTSHGAHTGAILVYTTPTSTSISDFTPSDAMSFRASSLSLSGNAALHAGNYSSYALPLSGGSLTGDLQLGSNYLKFDQSGTRSWNIRATGGNLDILSGDGSGSLRYNNGAILTSNNYSSYALPLTGGTLSGSLSIVSAFGTSTYAEAARFTNTSLNSGSKITFYGVQGSDASAKISGAIGFNQTVNSDSNGQPAFIVETGNNGSISEKFRVDSTGNIGVNNTSPINTAWGSNSKHLSINGPDYAVINLQGSLNGARRFSMGSGDNRFYMAYDNTAGRHNITVNDLGNVTAAVDFRAPLFYDSDNTAFYLDPNSTGTSLSVAGAIIAAGNITAYSDERLKSDWKTLDKDFVENLAEVLSGTFTRTDNAQRQAGVGAQSLQKLLPEAVVDNGILSVAYGNAAMVSAVELAKRVVQQEKRIALLEKRLGMLLGD
jgi:hypothetical protein